MNDHDGWTRPLPADRPRPTYWPGALALGVTVTLWGFVTTPVILGVGAAVGVVAIAGWIKELVRGAAPVDAAQDRNEKEVMDDG
ncbi:MAG: hypothetical protein P8099_14870 [Gemmatimonadota bacterium]|jgi:hypothetical protein